MEVLEPFVPYLVLVAVAFVFFVICWIFFGTSSKSKKKAVQTPAWDAFVEEEKRRQTTVRPDYGAEMLREAEERERLAEAAVAEAVLAQAQALALQQEQRAQQQPISHEGPGRVLQDEDASAPGKHHATLTGEDTGDITRIMPAVNEATQVIPRVEPPEAFHKTQVISNLTTQIAGAAAVSEAAAADIQATVVAGSGTALFALPAVAEGVPGVTSFFRMFGNVTPETAEAVVSITQEAFDRLGFTSEEELQAFQQDVVVQEALLCMQKAYSTTMTDWMRATALEIFLDVVQQPKSSTAYLVAFDALQILPHLSLGHFQAMAMVLLFKYSRNSNNYSAKHFRHYVRKYVEPFLSDLIVDTTAYRQLEYLRCMMMETSKEAFHHLLVQNYPLVFAVAGFTKEELGQVVPGRSWTEEEIVPSLVAGGYVKLPLVDEGMAGRYFRITNIEDPSQQRALLQLMRSRPVAFEGARAQQILEDISPILATFGRTYDKSPLSQVSLTLLGLYLARVHVKMEIGEEFDLSRWF